MLSPTPQLVVNHYGVSQSTGKIRITEFVMFFADRTKHTAAYELNWGTE